MFASRLHWRLLVGTILVLVAAAWLTPHWVRAPGLQENRVLAQRPAWPKRLQDLGTFRKAADAYVADRFPIRPHLIGVLNRLRMIAGVSGSSRVIVGRDGWLFFDDDTHLGATRDDPPMTGPMVRAWLMTLAGRTEALRARGAPYLVLVPPAKEAVYPQYAPAWFHGPSPARPALALPKLAEASGAGQVLYLYPPIARATRRGEKTYSRHDTHWTSYGAYAGYVGLLDRLHAMGLTEAPRPLSDFRKVDLGGHGPRDLALMLGVASLVDLDYPHFENPQGVARSRVSYLNSNTDWTGPQVVDTGEVGKPVLLMTRDSFSNELLPFLLPHFSRIVLAHNQDGFWRPDLIERFKPDIVILEVVEPGLRVAFEHGPPPSASAAARVDHVLGAATTAAPGAPANPLMPSFAPPDRATLAAIAAARPTDNCNFEIATLRPGVGRQATFTGSGWISELGPKITSPLGFLTLSGPRGILAAPVRADTPRPDVAAAYHNPNGRLSGFVGVFIAPELAPGAYVAAVYRRTGDGWISCRGKQALSAP